MLTGLLQILLVLFCANAQELETATDHLPPLVTSPFEGIYTLSITCLKKSPPCDNTVFANIDRLTIIDGGVLWGTWISIANKKSGTVLDTFRDVNLNPTTNKLSINPLMSPGFGPGPGGGGRFIYLDITLAKSHDSFSGTLIDGQTTLSYKIAGKKIRTAQEYLNLPAPQFVPPENLVGTYKGRLGPIKGSLKIGLLPDGRIFGFFASEKGPLGGSAVTFKYETASWDPQNGLLKMVFINSYFFTLGVLFLSLKNITPKTIQWVGFQSTSFVDNPVEMVKVP